MARPTNNQNQGYKVTTRLIDINQLVREAEGSTFDDPYWIYAMDDGERKFVQYNPYDWVKF
jgi:hypothetical protein